MKQRYRILSLLIVQLTTLSIFAFDFEVDGICYTVTSIEDFSVSVDGFKPSLSGIVTIPSTVTYNNRSFKVTSISSARGATIESVKIPTSVTTISGFSGTSIKSLYIPDNVVNIDYGTFSGCKSLESIRISRNVSVLSPCLFEDCANLKKVEWHPIESSKIQYNSFKNCTSLKSFTIPSTCYMVGTFDDYYRRYEIAFDNCSSLDSLIIEDGKRKIMFAYHIDTYSRTWDYGEFEGCPIKYLYLGRTYDCAVDQYGWQSFPSFTPYDLVIGDEVQSLVKWPSFIKTLVVGSSFSDLRGIPRYDYLEYIKVRQGTPPQASGFSNKTYMNTILYVPKGAKANYESADIWKNFWNIIEYSDDGTEVETKKCAKPIINYSKGKLIFICGTEGASCHSTITNPDITSYSTNEVQLGVTYNVSVYATKPGYENSEVATATLCWIDQLPDIKGIEDDEDKVTEVKAMPVLIQSEDGAIDIKGAEDGTNVIVYEINGKLVGSTVSYNGYANIRTHLQSGSTAIVKVADRSVKVLVK